MPRASSLQRTIIFSTRESEWVCVWCGLEEEKREIDELRWGSVEDEEVRRRVELWYHSLWWVSICEKNKRKWWKCVWFKKEEKFWVLLREEPLGRREWEVRTAKGGGRGCFAFVGFWNSVGSQMQIESRERNVFCVVLFCLVSQRIEREWNCDSGVGTWEESSGHNPWTLVRVDIMLASITLEWNYITTQEYGTTLVWFCFCSATLFVES